MNRLSILPILATLLIAGACSKPQQDASKIEAKTLFTLLPQEATGIDFANNLTYDKDFNIYTYRNFYNGGGVAIGDVNNDGLQDVFFTANMGDNKLYLNKGNWRFEDITVKAGVKGKGAWSTGVSMADVNGDGRLDIYVCNSGDIKGDNRQNELFINNGDGTFTEKAEAYGLADRGYSTHAAFFDYDKDGDLDMYLLNNSFQAIGSFNLRKDVRPIRDKDGGDKLFRNDGEAFTDVSEQANIYGSIIGFGLGVTVGDVNQDSWPDIYVSNDFFERDYLYLNNGDGTFREVLEQGFRSISAASMGADMADINNDAWPDIFVTDMLPEPDERLKTKTTFDNWNNYRYSLENGYWHQFTRNMLHLNNGDGTFSEIGRLAGVEATDWSWGALITDLDNDGIKDIFVANGIYQDLTDQDYINFVANEETMRSIITKKGVDFKTLIDSIPVEPVPNYAFHGNGNLTFTNRATEWGLGQPSFSNGSAYGDMDNDGDLDLIVNNINMPCFIYRNESNVLRKENGYLRFELAGEGKNPFALGTKITLKYAGNTQYLEQMPMRGFESTMDARPHFGLGKQKTVDTVLVEWPNGKATLLTNVPASQTMKLAQKDANLPAVPPKAAAPKALFRESPDLAGINYRHQENPYSDFDRERLLFLMTSTEGPKVATGDVNRDGREDFYIGGAKDQAGRLFVQQANGTFKSTNEAVWEADKVSEDQDCLFFDADGDRDLDLYVCSGGSELPSSSSALIDRLYINDGRGNFTKSEQFLPTFNFESTSCVDAADYDRDGDLDLFVGVRLRSFLYGVPCNGYILQNDGKGKFTDVTMQVAPRLNQSGLFRDGKWLDYDRDGDADLIVTGEWMPVRVFRNDGGKFSEQTESAGLAGFKGWWSCLESADLDNDGDLDLVVGNHGLNTRFQASDKHPVNLYVNDFDQNGDAEQLLTVYNGDQSYPLVLRHDLVAQIPSLKKKYLKYRNFARQTMTDIFTPAQLEKAVVQEATTMETAVFINDGKGRFTRKALPVQAQLSPVMAILVADLNGDGQQDILLGGNLFNVKPEIGRFDASYGALLAGNGKGGFQFLPATESGIRLNGEVRDFAWMRVGQQQRLIVVRNNDAVQVFGRE